MFAPRGFSVVEVTLGLGLGVIHSRHGNMRLEGFANTRASHPIFNDSE